RAGEPVRDLPGDEERLHKDVGEEAEPRDDAVDAEVGGRVPEDLDVERIARLRACDVDRPREGMPEAEVERRAVGVRAVAGQLPVETVARHERDRLAR